MYLAFFDFDSTLIEQEIIDELAALKGRKEEIAAITRETMEGKHKFSETIHLKTEVLEGLTLRDLENVASTITFRQNFGPLMRWLKEKEFKTAVITGSFDNMLSLLPQTSGFDFIYANSLEVIDGSLTGKCVPRVADNKGAIAESLKKKLGIPTERCVAVGDGSTDIPVFMQSSLSIALNAKPIVRDAASVALDTNNLEDLIPPLEAWLCNRG
ncbi:phosphoserine phosphatase SerB [Candidatus Micrarchaeota archaeon]|nr:phosphoserine phosphatase SerB [Candidatus Micrarchaeota archaeon]